jgi:hypothetical protein
MIGSCSAAGPPLPSPFDGVVERMLQAGGAEATGSYDSSELEELTADSHPLPNLDVAVIRRLDRLEVDGLLGLDFLTHFEHIHFHTRSLQLELG